MAHGRPVPVGWLDLLQAALNRSHTQQPADAADTLITAARLVRGLPFTARRGYAWADHHNDGARTITNVARRLAELANHLDRPDLLDRAHSIATIGLGDPAHAISERVHRRVDASTRPDSA